jgi:hypothetical protein
LDKQIKEKKERKKAEQEQDRQYLTLQQEHLVLLEEREKQMSANDNQKRLNEKASRESQLREAKMRKDLERRDEKHKEREIVRRIKADLECEKNLAMERRKQERDYLNRMM